MSMHGSYDEYGQNDTADLVRSVALSSAKLWEEVFDRLRQLEAAQGELRAMLGRIEAQLPAGPANAALAAGAPSAPAWPDRAITAAEPASNADGSAQTDLFLPGPVDDPISTAENGPRDAVDLLVGSAASPVMPTPVMPAPVDDEPATFFFPPADEAPRPVEPTSSEAGTGWPESDLLGTPGWTSPRIVRYDEGFTSRDVVGPPTEEVRAIDVTPPERTNAEYFGRHAAGPPPGFAVANGDAAPPVVGFEAEVPQVQVPQVQVPQVQVPEVQVPEADQPYDPAIDLQLQQAAQAVELQAVTPAGPATAPATLGFATDAGSANESAPAFDAWDDGMRVPLVFAPGDEPTAPPANGAVPQPPVGFASDGEVPAPPLGFGTLGGDVPPPPPGFGVGEVPPPPPGFASNGDVPPPPPPGFGIGEVPAPPLGFGTLGGDVPLPPPGFAAGGDVPPPPPPPGFSSGSADVTPPPPPGFTIGGDLPPADGAGQGGNAQVAPPPPPPPPGFAANGFAMPSATATPAPPPGFGAAPAGAAPAGAAPAAGASVPPPPPPGFAPGANGQQVGPPRTPSVSGSIADDVLAISSIAPPVPQAGDNGAGTPAGNGNGHAPADDGPPPPITPDFFARAGRRRR